MHEQIQRIMGDAREARSDGRRMEARTGYGRAAELARAVSENLLLAHALRHMSDLDREGGDSAAALTAGQEAVSLYRAAQPTSPLDLANALRVTALALGSLARPNDAIAMWAEARELYMALGVQEGVDECDVHLRQPE